MRKSGQTIRVTRRFTLAAGEEAAAEFQAAECLVARLIARAYFADHFGFTQDPEGAAGRRGGSGCPATSGAPSGQKRTPDDDLAIDAPDG